MLNLETAEQRHVVAVALDLAGMLRHHMRHKLVCLLKNVVGVDQNVAHIAVEVVTNRADDKRRFLVNQERALTSLASFVNGRPQLGQVI